LSHRNDDPEAASRPFELQRDGMVNGEGAAAVVIESRAHAEARGARPLARILSGGRSYESRLNGTPPSGDGLRRAVRAALAEADVSPQQLGHVNADGISSVEMDRVEAAALQSCLGDVPVTAVKSFFGNLGSGVGLVELAASLCALEQRQIPPTLNYQTPDPQCPLQVVRELTSCDSPLALTVNQSSSGQCVALLLQRSD
jgi:3-oxoacyl-[acyl-carrier-protein] synthase II